LKSAHEATKAQLKTDPMTLGVMRRVIPPLAPLDLKNPASMQALDIAAGIVEQRYQLGTISPLSDQQVDALKGPDRRGTHRRQGDIYRDLRNGFSDESVKAIAAQLAGKKESITAWTMGLSMEAPRAASTILRGQEINSTRMDEAVQELTGGVLNVGGGIFSRGYKIQPPRYGMTEGEFKDLLNVADYSKAKGFKAEDIRKHGVFESIGDGKYLVKVGPIMCRATAGHSSWISAQS
jgi:hypothetical protein